jgi:RNA polymerase primary sigma factor
MPSTPSSAPRGPIPDIDDYYGQIREEALLTPSEELDLAAAISRGDTEARARLIRANLRLVIKIARGYTGRGLPLEDLVGEGNLGLIRAAEGFDPRFGTRFSTYAAYWIRQSIGQALTNTAALIRLPAHVVVLLGKWKRVERRLRREHGQTPGAEQMIAELGLTAGQYALIERALKSQCLLHEGSEESPLWTSEAAADPQDPPGATLEADEERGGVQRRLDLLDSRERTVLGLRFGLGGEEPQTLKEVGIRLGITREWVRKIELRALAKLEAEYLAAEEAFLDTVRRLSAQKAGGYPTWDEVVAVATRIEAQSSSTELSRLA